MRHLRFLSLLGLASALSGCGDSGSATWFGRALLVEGLNRDEGLVGAFEYARRQVARRETMEETGVAAAALAPIGFIDYRRSRKRVYGFSGSAPADAAPRPASWEVDRAEFVPLDTATTSLHPDQRPFLERLLELIAGQRTG